MDAAVASRRTAVAARRADARSATATRLVAAIAIAAAIAPGPVRLADARPLDGATLYALHCSRCHGPTGHGDGEDAELFRTRPRDLTSGFLRRYATRELVARIRNGRRLNLALDPSAVRARAGGTEEIVRHLERLPSVDWRLVERGEELFTDRCEICHGPFGRPSGVRPPGVAQPADVSSPEFQHRVSNAEIAETVRRGHGSMPGLVPRIDVADVPAVVAFVRLLSPGYERYTRYCAACHGDDGRGPGVRFDDTTRTPTVVFDAAYFKRTDPERVRGSVWHMADEQQPEMPHLRGRLSDAEAHAIVEYLKRSVADGRRSRR